MVKASPIDLIEKKKFEKDIENIVNKGAPVKEDSNNDEMLNPPKKEKYKVITLRFPESFLKRIDMQNKKRTGLSRNAWILEAIQEKLDRE